MFSARSLFLLGFALAALWTSARAQDTSQAGDTRFKAVTDAVRDICVAPDKHGQYLKVEGKGGGDVSVKPLRFLGVAGLKAEATFTREEWDGVRKVMEKDQVNENARYRQCVEKLTPLFLDKFIAKTELRGYLRPSNDPSPRADCQPSSPNALGVFYGSSVAYSSRLPLTIVEIRGQSLLSINRDANGLKVSARVFGADGRIVVEVIDNEFIVNPSNYFKLERPDISTLIVYDQYNEAVLTVRYLNPSAIRVLGTFRFKGGPPVVITENEVRSPAFSIEHSCSPDSRVVMSLN